MKELQSFSMYTVLSLFLISGTIYAQEEKTVLQSISYFDFSPRQQQGNVELKDAHRLLRTIFKPACHITD